MTRAGRVLTALLLLAALTACAGPTVTAAEYRDKVAQTAKALTGLLVTARHAVELDLGGRMLPTVTDTVVSDAERDAVSVQTTIESRQPPDAESDRLRLRMDGPVRAATALLTDLRIAVRSGDSGAQRAALARLEQPLGDLEQLSEVSA
ncbi:hypothetical protein [Amycolatopsis dongchuanensis]|uniref:Uncharacterized protein n=1 Tax=Amycolatopsis dongchuanensis TaxID=1070866 RepID=A0ABP9QN72_9PSEU